MSLYSFLADAVVVLHATYVAVVVFGLLAVLLGGALRWRWVRNPWFRTIHFLMILIVTVLAASGNPCPLTTLEKCLRRKGGGTAYAESFIGYWVQQLIFYEFEAWVFTVCYALFAAAVLATLIFIPPRWPGKAAD